MRDTLTKIKKHGLLIILLLIAIAAPQAATLINLTYQVTGILPHANGGTDIASPGGSGNVLTSNGTTWFSGVGGTVTGSGTNPHIVQWNGSTSITSLSAPTACSAGNIMGGIDTGGNSTGCLTPGGTSTTGFSFGGDGSDGAITFDGTNTYSGIETHTGSSPNFVYTLVRDVFATTLTVSSSKTVKNGNFSLYGSTSIDVEGTVDNSGTTSTGQNATSDATGGSFAGSLPLPAVTTPFTNGNGGGFGGSSHTTGGNGSPGGGGANVINSVFASARSSTTWKGGDGGTGAGGAGGTGGSNGADGTFTSTKSASPRMALRAFLGLNENATGTASTFVFGVPALYNGVSGGGGGAGGGGDGSNNGALGGSGGACGTNGGWILLVSPSITIGASGVLKAIGGNGSNGAVGANATAGGNRGGGGGGAGGCGGNGGAAILVYHTLSNSGTLNVAAGTHGSGAAGGSGAGGGTGGATGQDGPDGLSGITTPIQIVQ
jgi:hypothetical protein